MRRTLNRFEIFLGFALLAIYAALTMTLASYTLLRVVASCGWRW